MCNVDPQTMNSLTKTVEQFLEEGRSFTGYDVTIATREREGTKIRHQDVRQAVHEMGVLQDALDFGYTDQNGKTTSWSKTQKTMPNGGWAYVFHPSHVFGKNYIPRNPGGLAGVTAVPNTTPALSGPSISLAQDGTTNDSGGEQDDGSFGTDYRGRLLVSTRFFREAGISPNDRVAVVTDPSSQTIFVMKEVPNHQQSGTLTVQVVERNGDIRLSPKTLHAAHFQGTNFSVQNSERKIGTSPVKVVEIKENAVASN